MQPVSVSHDVGSNNKAGATHNFERRTEIDQTLELIVFMGPNPS